MATATFSVNAAGSVSDDAGFRAYGSGLSGALAAIGMVKTADTGQINWSTVTKPTGSNTQAGYEVWRFNDSLQATHPLFLRIGYGTGSGATIFSIWYTLGKSSDGAGNIGSPFAAMKQLPYQGSNAGVHISYLSSGDGSSMVIALTPNLSALGTILVVERSRTAAGAAVGTSFMLLNREAGAVPVTYGYNYSSGVGVQNVGWPVQPPINGSMASGGKAPLWTAIITDGAGNFWQPRSIVSGNNTDLGSASAITVPGWGIYMPISQAIWGPHSSTANLVAPAFVWS